MKLTRYVPGNFYCDGMTSTWLADAEFDVSGFDAESTVPVSFVATVEVPSGAVGVFGTTTGGAAEQAGSTTLAAVAVTGPAVQHEVTGTALAGVSQSAGKVLVHVCASTSNASLPVEVTGISITMGTDD